MIKKPNLAAALHEASGKKQAVAMLASANESAPVAPAGKPPSRAGKKVVAGHFDPAVIRQLKMLAMDNDTSIQSLLSKALNDLFEKNSMKPIA